MPVNYPTDKDRLSIIGRTGSGKTQAAKWHLSFRNFHTMPWVVYNFKYDESLDGIPYAKHIGIGELPIQPGVFIVHPFPDDQEGLENQMRAIWERGNTGVYVDEGYMVGTRNPWFRNLLTQGRSKKIPMIILSQRPTWMDRFVFSESGFFQIFDMTDSDDTANAQRFIKQDISKPLPEFHSYYYEVKNRKLNVLKPVPENNVLDQVFARRLGQLRTKKII